MLDGILPCVGAVPYRPLGQSHFVPAPGSDSYNDQAYLPSVMTDEALRKGLEKSTEPLPAGLSPERESKLFSYLRMKLSGIWSGDNFQTYEESVARLNWQKSAGHPYYYTCEDKACAVTCFGAEIERDVRSVVEGQDLWLPFTLTLKDELRTADRVKAGKTRVFSASNIVHHLASSMLFDKQNDKLRATLGEHPLTIGIGVPGPQFVSAVKSVSSDENCTDADASGCDQRFFLSAAKIIRELRVSFHKPEYATAIRKLYDDVYCGYVICQGRVYIMLHNKSGWKNTGDDNGMFLWLSAANYILDATLEAYGEECQISEIDDYWNGLINGDDSLTAWYEPCSAVGWAENARKWNLQLELGSKEPKYAIECTFLSHTLRERFVPGLGDIVVAAGNLSKLKSSLEWVRYNSDFSMEECFLMHLLGLRICLWPWKHEFDLVEERIDAFIGSFQPTPAIRNLLKARISELTIMDLHLRLEGAFSFFRVLSLVGVPDSIISAIFSEVVGNMPKITAQEVARRAAQSAKDKKLQKSQKPSKVKLTSEINSGGRSEKVVSAPAAKGFETATTFRRGASKRFKDGIVVEGSDHLEYVAVPSGEAVGVVCNEIYINPSELGGTRLQQYANLYEKYLFDLLEFEFLPAVGSTQPGAIILAYDRDVMDDTPPANEQGVRQFSAMEGAKDGNVWSKHVVRARLLAPDAGYFTNPVIGSDDRLAYQGQFYVAITVPTGLSANAVLGRLRIHYRCHFFVPQLESVQITAQGQSAYGLANASSLAAALNRDWFAGLVQFTGPVWEGYQKIKPVADSLGKFYIPLAQGVYRLSNKLYETGPAMMTTETSGTVSFNTPVVVPNEPMPASAPQPWVNTAVATNFVTDVAHTFSGIAADWLLGVPRGGAKVYSSWSSPAIGVADDSGTLSLVFDSLVSRIGGYQPSVGGLFTMVHQGVEECANPEQFIKEARDRAVKLGYARQPVAKKVVPCLEEIPNGDCSTACCDCGRAKQLNALPTSTIDKCPASQESRTNPSLFQLQSRSVVPKQP